MSVADAGPRAARAAADAAARHEAVRRFTGCVALEAGAGTGKTTVLVNRVVAWCLGPGFERAATAGDASGRTERAARKALDGVVAVTFTEAAAAEMALRIGQALRALERGELPLGLAAEDVPPAALSAARARALLAALDQLVVQSIHAFCRGLLARHPLEAGLHPRFEVDGDGAGQRAAVRGALRDALTEAFASGPESDLVQLCLRDASADELELALLALLGQGVPPALFEEDPCAPPRVAALFEELAATLSALLDAEGGRLAGVGVGARVIEAVRAARAAIDLAPATAAGLAVVADAVREHFPKNLLDRLGEWRRGAELGKREEAALADAAGAVFAASAALEPLVSHVAALDPARLARVRRVVGVLLADALARLQREGLVPFATLLSAARALLAKHPEIAAFERRRIDQLLVDEFQDTDPVQCEIVARLALEGPEAERPGLFLVGDPKQSIYGWRSADLAAYEGFLSRALAGAEPLRLVQNRRSPAAILEEVERVIAPAMRAEPGVQPRFEPLLEDPERNAGAPAHPVEAWVCYDVDDLRQSGRVTLPVAASRRLEAATLARDLRRLHGEEVRYADCAVLLRAASDLDPVLDALREGGVPFAVESDRSYYQRREVLDASALVRAVLDPNDSLALVAWLRSPAVGVPDAAWLPLFEAGLPRLARELRADDPAGAERLAAAVRGAAAAVPDGVPGLERVAGFGESLIAAVCDLARLRASFETEAPDRFVERLRRVVLVEASEAARHLGGHRLAHLERFLRELLGWLEDGVADAASVVRALREASVREPDPFEGPPRSPLGDAVRVMTVHRAKGLDFDHVYLLSVEKTLGSRGAGAVEVCRADEPPDYCLLGARTPGFHVLQALRGKKGRAEEVRALYVALTRARRRVVVSGRFPAARKPLDDAACFADLLGHRSGGLPDLVAETLAAADEGRSELVQGGVRWRFPALEVAGAGPTAGEPAAPDLASAEEIAAASERLGRLGAEARVRAGRPRSRGAAPEKDAERDERRIEDRLGAEEGARSRSPARGPDRDIALAIGTAVHAALEGLDLDGSASAVRAQAETTLTERLAGELGPAGRAPAEREARRLLAGFLEGPLFAQLRRLAPHVVARELPVLLAPDASDGPEAPIGCWSGVVDLVYRDPATGELAIADYKTDRVAADEVCARALGYQAQGRVYARALQAALELPARPRFELWFVDPGRIEVVPLDGAPDPR